MPSAQIAGVTGIDYFYDAIVQQPEQREVADSPIAVARAVANSDRKKKEPTQQQKKRKAKRDPNKPKGWLTANLLFANTNRAKVVEEYPNASFGDVVSTSFIS